MLEKVSINDILELQKICLDSYSQIFANHWTENGLELYLEREFGTRRLKLELTDDNYEYHFIKKNGKNVGFIKINYKSSDELSELDNCELEKIYILPSYSGMGIGKTAMTAIINQVQQKTKKVFFLCVIDTNKNAIAFYENLGFEFYGKTRLEAPHFRDELRGMNRMQLKLNKEYSTDIEDYS